MGEEQNGRGAEWARSRMGEEQNKTARAKRTLAWRQDVDIGVPFLRPSATGRASVARRCRRCDRPRALKLSGPTWRPQGQRNSWTPQRPSLIGQHAPALLRRIVVSLTVSRP